MQRWMRAILAVCSVLLLAGAVQAQEEEDYYLDEEIEQEDPRYALGLGFGLVELGDNVVEGQTILVDDDVEQYLTLNLRIRFGDPYANQGPGRAGFRGYLEPEIAYWDGEVQSDLLLGINIVGGMPVNAVEFFVGGGIGIHFIDRDFGSIPSVRGLEDSDEALGVNAHFGVDVSVSKRVSLFGVGRFDLVDDDRDELEGKAYLGLRFRLGGRK